MTPTLPSLETDLLEEVNPNAEIFAQKAEYPLSR
jgi:hypothetical protein